MRQRRRPRPVDETGSRGNHFAQRVPVLEEKMKAADRRIGDLEEKAEALEQLHTHSAG